MWETYWEQAVGGLCAVERMVGDNGVGELDCWEGAGVHKAVYLHGMGRGLSE